MSSEASAGKAQSVLDFVAHVQERLSKDADADGDASSQECPDVLFYIRALPLPRKELSPNQRLEFDRKGAAIWNTCCKLVTKTGTLQYSAHLAEATGRLETAARIVEQIASKQESMSWAPQGAVRNNGYVVDDLKEQYLLLRVALAWKQDRLDLAEHFYAQIEPLQANLNSDRTVQLIDLCYEIGDDQVTRKHGSRAAKWLKRACTVCSFKNAETTDVDIQDLRLTLLHTYVRALLLQDGPETDDEAHRTLLVLREVLT
ncbi:hypothetical protein A1O3_09305 [Capronia epimyces CBS 606.96]|uniref:Protein ZIP4 homolog n=1 Tax=Capronia epimyces CBS 606.96 TaxID=1182542 RepID=W9Y6U5_9EURO|nr:uncharacterized protein A1O3_09305 [Capronia epimyces CBS 606.96]EXJ78144.1 hypothetical protein A1O3_09305 [Capronia epimyces CBS 606.96]